MKHLNFFLQNKHKGTIVRSDLITALIFNKIQFIHADLRLEHW